MGDLREPNGCSTEDTPVPSTSIGPHLWAQAEKATQKIITKVQPTAVSENRRREVIDYVQRLIRTSLNCEVFPYGSVPLKTYLPDGDIDLTAFGGSGIEESLPMKIASVLEREERNETAEFVVKDVQLIRAEVKLVKCIVQNIVVDISINQIGGLCTLCFLEQVDRLIGKDNLFKRSIILIKAWCYYESRILGAHHALISTYALETLVLYIFHLFHSRLDGPLAVLYKFLDYFSKFDWENYCISLTGPVHVSALPEILAEIPDNGGDDLLLSSDFLRYCIDMFSVPSRGGDTNSRTFQEKHLNIVDPLKENNNLGRSVSKGNFYRIKSAFTYGAKKLGRILLQSEDNIASELHNFFSNTLERHGHGERPDVQGYSPLPNSSPFIPESESFEKHVADFSTPEDCRTNPDVALYNRVGDIEVANIGTTVCIGNGLQEHSTDVNGLLVDLDEAEDLTKSRAQGHEISYENSKLSPSPSSAVESVSVRRTPYYAPHLYYTNAHLSVGEVNLDSRQLSDIEEKISLEVSQGSDDICCLPDGKVMTSRDVSSEPNEIHSSVNSSTDYEVGSSGSPKPTYSLSDLSGDLENHFSCLQYGRWWYEFGAGVPVLPITALQPHFQMNIPWDASQHPSHLQNGYSHGNVNGNILSSAFYMNPLVMPRVAFGLEDRHKPRGTGTYFPNMNRPPPAIRHFATKGRNQPLLRSPRRNGRTATSTETENHDSSSSELPLSEGPYDQSGTKHGASDVQRSFSPRGKGHPKISGLVAQPEEFVEFGSVGQVPLVTPSVDRSRQQRLASSSSDFNPVSPTMGMQRLKPVFSRDQDRMSAKSYRLKDEDDFPPLSV